MNGGMGSLRRMDYLQAENQLKTFSQETGGYSWFPQFAGEMPDVFRNVAAFLRHQYSLSYSPTAGAKDGKFHKVKVELVAPDGGTLSIVDQKGKKQKYQGYSPEGYQATKPRSEEHTSELQSQSNLVCRLLLEKKKKTKNKTSNQ